MLLNILNNSGFWTDSWKKDFFSFSLIIAEYRRYLHFNFILFSHIEKRNNKVKKADLKKVFRGLLNKLDF